MRLTNETPTAWGRTAGIVAAVVLCAAVAAPGPAPAQPETPDKGVLLSELVVEPRTPGPAWWRVSGPDSAVYVLAIPQVTPPGMAWDQSVLDRRLEGANVLLSPMDFSAVKSAPGMAVALAHAPLALFRRPRPSPPEAVPLETRLSPELRSRFVAAREALGQPAERYASLSYVRAAYLIADDYRRRQALAEGEVWSAIEAAARRRRVRTEPAYSLALPTSLDVELTPEAGGPECLDHALTAMVERARLERAAAEAWAQGDVRGLIKPIPREALPHCRLANVSFGVAPGGPAFSRLEEDFKRQQVDAIERALRRPGRSVAVLNVFSPFGQGEADSLLSEDGVLYRLRDKGYTITSPANLD